MSMSRREIRENVFKLLFRVEFNTPEEMAEQEELFFSLRDEEEGEMTAQDSNEISEKYKKIEAQLKQIDAEISAKATGWAIERIGKVDLTIIRLAVYEILFDETIDTAVAINEAVELAKKFGREESSAFVNGVLHKFAE